MIQPWVWNVMAVLAKYETYVPECRQAFVQAPQDVRDHARGFSDARRKARDNQGRYTGEPVEPTTAVRRFPGPLDV